MLNYLWAGMMMLGIIYAAFTGRMPDITNTFGFEVVFRWLCPIEKQSVTNALSANSLRFAQIYFFAMCLFYNHYSKLPCYYSAWWSGSDATIRTIQVNENKKGWIFPVN